MTRSVRALMTGVCLVSGCEATVVPGPMVIDSAGVQVTLSEPADLVFAELDSMPVLSVGALDATGPTRFQGIQGMHVDRDGRVWVTQATSADLRVFESDGSHWKTRGESGDGPGQFKYARLIGAAAGDSVLVADLGLQRLTVFDPNGEFVRSGQLPDVDGPGILPPLRVDRDGLILGQIPRTVPRALIDVGQAVRDSVELVGVDVGSSSLRSYGTFPEPLAIWTGQTQAPIPFMARPSFDVTGEEVHLVTGSDFRVQVFEERGLQRIYGIDRPARPISEAQVEAYRDFVQEYFPEELKADALAALDHELRPNRLPAYDRVLLSSDGHIWVQIYDPDLWAPHDWDVFDAEGRFVGQVRIENQFYPMVIDQEAVFGVWRDTLGLEQIRAYRYVRP